MNLGLSYIALCIDEFIWRTLRICIFAWDLQCWDYILHRMWNFEISDSSFCPKFGWDLCFIVYIVGFIWSWTLYIEICDVGFMFWREYTFSNFENLHWIKEWWSLVNWGNVVDFIRELNICYWIHFVEVWDFFC